MIRPLPQLHCTVLMLLTWSALTPAAAQTVSEYP